MVTWVSFHWTLGGRVLTYWNIQECVPPMGCFFTRNHKTWVPFSTKISLNMGLVFPNFLSVIPYTHSLTLTLTINLTLTLIPNSNPNPNPNPNPNYNPNLYPKSVWCVGYSGVTPIFGCLPCGHPNGKRPKIVKNGPIFREKSLKLGTLLTFLPKWPLKMGMGFEAWVAHPIQTKYEYPLGTGHSHSGKHFFFNSSVSSAFST